MKEKRYTITLRKNIVKFQTNIQTTYSSLIFVRPREFLALYFQQWQRSLFDRLLVVWQLQLGLDELFLYHDLWHWFQYQNTIQQLMCVLLIHHQIDI